jgi:hypothetical protein
MCSPPPFDLPDALSDQAAAELVDCLYAFAAYVESRYFAQIRRHYEIEADAVDPRQQRLFDDAPLFDEPLF